MNTCQHPGEHHSSDRVTVYTGDTTPHTVCGFHSDPASIRKMLAAVRGE